MNHLFANLLSDESAYDQAEAFWASLWEKTSPLDRKLNGWQVPWFQPQPPKDANPIFSAIAGIQKKGIRIIQYEPTSTGVELDFWLDTFGGSPIDPNAIRELVIACALSQEAAEIAHKLISSWIVGEIELSSGARSGLTMIQPSRPRWQEFSPDIEFSMLTPAA